MYSQQISPDESVICDLLAGNNLNYSQGQSFFYRAMRGKLQNSKVRAALVLLANKGETAQELFAAWKSIRSIEKNTLNSVSYALDTCGTGGDSSHSVNLSTLSSFVMAAAGVCVIKHGNRAITSLCGSSDLLSAFGMNLDQKSSSVIRSAQKIGVGYFHAPHIHPVYSRFQVLRRGIHMRTLFNLLGPVLNPVNIKYQILGVASSVLLPLYADLLPRMGRQSALIVQGAYAMDEITTLGESHGFKLSGRKVEKWSLNPVALGFKIGRFSELEIQSITHAKKKAIQILKLRKSGAAFDSVVLSAACGIWIAGKADSIPAGIRLAQKALHSGKAWEILNQMIGFSKL